MSLGPYTSIRVDDAGEIVTLTFCRPPVNVLNIAMMDEINDALAGLRDHPTAKVLVIAGEGKAFSAGVDVGDHAADRIDAMMASFGKLFQLLRGFTIPTVAVVDGAALGGGCEVATFCDIILASDKAKFGQPEIKLGVFPPVAAAVFPELVGRSRSLALLLTGDVIPAADAERMGMVYKVFPAAEFAAGVDEFLKKLTACSKVILEMTKRAVDGGRGLDRMDAIARAEHLYMHEMMATADAHEGLAAFLEKRAPHWTNK